MGIQQAVVNSETTLGSSGSNMAKKVSNRVRNSRSNEIQKKDAHQVSSQNQVNATRNRVSNTHEGFKTSVFGISKRNRFRMSSSFGSISELEPVEDFCDSMSSLSQLTGSGDSLQLSLSSFIAIAQGPSLFDSPQSEKNAVSAPKMPQRGYISDPGDDHDDDDDSEGSISLEDIIEEASGHTCDTTDMQGRTWSEATRTGALGVNMPIRADSISDNDSFAAGSSGTISLSDSILLNDSTHSLPG